MAGEELHIDAFCNPLRTYVRTYANVRKTSRTQRTQRRINVPCPPFKHPARTNGCRWLFACFRLYLDTSAAICSSHFCAAFPSPPCPHSSLESRLADGSAAGWNRCRLHLTEIGTFKRQRLCYHPKSLKLATLLLLSLSSSSSSLFSGFCRARSGAHLIVANWFSHQTIGLPEWFVKDVMT